MNRPGMALASAFRLSFDCFTGLSVIDSLVIGEFIEQYGKPPVR